MANLAELLVQPALSIRDAMGAIDRNGIGIVLVVDAERHLLGTITDGDVRRAILSGVELTRPVADLLDHKAAPFAEPLVAAAGTPADELLRLLTKSSLRHIPLLDDERRVVDVATLDELAKSSELPMRAVVMAGGSGTRLKPLTDDAPKSMLPIGDRPLLELIVEQLRSAGINQVSVTTHYLGEQIQKHFGAGEEFGVEIRYVDEDEPLGTAGALSLLDPSDEPMLVMNGDILTRVDFRAFRRFHDEHRAEMTVAVRPYEVEVPFGVVETHGVDVARISEKPVLRHLVNAGIYLLDPGVLRYVPQGERYDMIELIQKLVAEGKNVVAFPVHEYWIDIGQHESYERARRDAG